MVDTLAGILAVVVCVVVAFVMWPKDWWGKIISVLFAAAAVQGIFENFWVFLAIIVIGAIAASGSK